MGDLDLKNHNLNIRTDVRPSFRLDTINYSYVTPDKKIEGKFFGREIDIKKEFSNFVSGPSNREAVNIASHIAKNPGNRGVHSTIFLHSSPGLGKTHLLYAIANEIRKVQPTLNVALVSGRSFCQELMVAMQNQNSSSFHNLYSNVVDVLLIDDIHEFYGKTELQKVIFHIFKNLYEQGKQIVFTADNSPTRIFSGYDSVLSTMFWGKEIVLKKPDYETRIKIIRQKKIELNLKFDQRLEHLLAINFTDNIRILEGSLLKLSAFCDLQNVRDIATDRGVMLLDLKEINSSEVISFDQIAQTVAAFYKINVSKIVSRDRDRTTQNARMVLIYLSKTLARLTFKEIGISLGARHHSTIMDAFDKISLQLSEDTMLAKNIFEIESSINH